MLGNVPKNIYKPSDDTISYMIDDIVRFLEGSKNLKKVEEFSDADLMAFLLFYIYLRMSPYFRDAKRCNVFLQLYLSTNPNGWEDQHFLCQEWSPPMHPTLLVILTFIQSLFNEYVHRELDEEECRTIFSALFVKTNGNVSSLEPRFRKLVKTLLEGEKPRKQRKVQSLDTKSQVELGSITNSLKDLSLE